MYPYKNSLNEYISDDYFRENKKFYLLDELIDHEHDQKPIDFWKSRYPNIPREILGEYLAMMYGPTPKNHWFRVFNKLYYLKMAPKLWECIMNGYDRRNDANQVDSDFGVNFTHYMFDISAVDSYPSNSTIKTSGDYFLVKKTVSSRGNSDRAGSSIDYFTGASHTQQQDDSNFKTIFNKKIYMQLMTPKKLIKKAINVIQQIHKLYPSIKSQQIDMVAFNDQGEFEIRYHNIVITNVTPLLPELNLQQDVYTTHGKIFNVKWSIKASIVYFEYLVEKEFFKRFRFHRTIQTFVCTCKTQRGIIIFDYLKAGLTRITLHGKALEEEKMVFNIIYKMRNMYDDHPYTFLDDENVADGNAKTVHDFYKSRLLNKDELIDICCLSEKDYGTNILNYVIFSTVQEHRRLTHREIRLQLYAQRFQIQSPYILQKLRHIQLADIYPKKDIPYLLYMYNNHRMEICFRKRIIPNEGVVTTYSRATAVEPLVIDNVLVPTCTTTTRNKISTRHTYNFFKMSIEAAHSKYGISNLFPIHDLIKKPYVVEYPMKYSNLGTILMKKRLRNANLLIPVFVWDSNVVFLDNIATTHLNSRIKFNYNENFTTMFPLFVNTQDSYDRVRTTCPLEIETTEQILQLFSTVVNQIEYNSNAQPHQLDENKLHNLYIYTENIRSKFYGFCTQFVKQKVRPVISVCYDSNFNEILIVQKTLSTLNLPVFSEAPIISRFGSKLIYQCYHVNHFDQLKRENSIIYILGSKKSQQFCKFVIENYAGHDSEPNHNNSSTLPYPHERMVENKRARDDHNCTSSTTTTVPNDNPICLAYEDDFDIICALYALNFSRLESAAFVISKKDIWSRFEEYLISTYCKWYDYKLQWIGFHNQLENVSQSNCNFTFEVDLNKFLTTMKFFEKLENSYKSVKSWQEETFKSCLYETVRQHLISLPVKRASIADNINTILSNSSSFYLNRYIRDVLRYSYRIWTDEKRLFSTLTICDKVSRFSFSNLTQSKSIICHSSRNKRKVIDEIEILSGDGASCKRKKIQNTNSIGDKKMNNSFEYEFENYLNRSSTRNLQIIESPLFVNITNNILKENVSNFNSNNTVQIANVNDTGSDNSHYIEQYSLPNSFDYGGNLLFALKDLHFILHPVMDDSVVYYKDGSLQSISGENFHSDKCVRKVAIDDIDGTLTTEREINTSTRLRRSGFRNKYYIVFKTSNKNQFVVKEFKFEYTL